VSTRTRHCDVSCLYNDIVVVGLATTTTTYRLVFQHLPEPNRACLVGVNAVTLDPLLSSYME